MQLGAFTDDNTTEGDSKPLLGTDRRWLAVVLSVGVLVYVTYLATHSHPAYEGGLYLQIAEEIIQNGYALPEQIPYYLDGGVPFAYPPLMFYVIALITDVTGIDPVALELYGAGLVTIGSLIPYYYIAKEFLDTPRKAGIASVFFAVTPPVLRWHISAGGIVRAAAILLALCGIYVGLRLFRRGEHRARWILAGVVLFTLTVLTHPVYTVFFAGSYLLLYLGCDRTTRGLLSGVVVAGGGIVLTAPWWLQIANIHGLDIFLTASGTHTGLTGGVDRLKSRFVMPLWRMNALTPFYAAAFAGGLYALLRRRYLLVTWMVLASYVIGKQRFTFVAGALLVSLLVVDVIHPVVVRSLPSFDRSHKRAIPTLLATVIVIGAIGTGVAFAGSQLAINHDGSHTQPQTFGESDLIAAEWITNNTSRSDSFVVLGDAAEWVPYYTERTILISPWGAEWTSTARYYQEYELFRDTSTCTDVDCLQVRLGVAELDPDYVYVPTKRHTVHSEEYSGRIDLVRSMTVSDRYELVYENDGVAIFEVNNSTAKSA